jgi:PAS domain S-box-containing protein
MSNRRPHDLTIEELREILSLPNHLIAIIKPDGTFYKVNEEANPVLGWEPEEIIGKKVKDYVHPEDWEMTYAHMVSVFVGSRPLVEDMRNRVLRKDGAWRWISWTGKAKGGLIYAHGSDVTEKVEYEEALTVQSLVLESINEAVIICNEKGVIVFANSAAEKLYGYDVEELLEKKIFSLSPDSREKNYSQAREIISAVKTHRIWKGEFENIRKNGTSLSTSCSITTLDLGGEKHYVCVQRDITSDKKLSQERELLLRHTQEAIRSRDEFLSIASHELKTPLQSLSLQNQMRKRLIEKDAPHSLDKENLLRSLDLDQRQLTRMNRLIDDMLDISRIRNS